MLTTTISTARRTGPPGGGTGGDAPRRRRAGSAAPSGGFTSSRTGPGQADRSTPVGRLDEGDGLAGDRLAAADRPDVLAGLGLDVHVDLPDAEQPRQVRPDGRLVRAQLGLLGVD